MIQRIFSFWLDLDSYWRSQPKIAAEVFGTLFKTSFGLIVLGPLATSSFSDDVTLNWRDNSNNEQGFHIERSSEFGEFERIASVGANVTTYKDSSVEEGVTYQYRVCAYNDSGKSGYTNIADFFIPVVETFEQWLSRMLSQSGSGLIPTLSLQTPSSLDINPFATSLPLLACYSHGINPLRPNTEYLPKLVRQAGSGSNDYYIEHAVSKYTLGVEIKIMVSQNLQEWTEYSVTPEPIDESDHHFWQRYYLDSLDGTRYFKVEHRLASAPSSEDPSLTEKN